jgi:CBS domain containing-hemolysin-like protein
VVVDEYGSAQGLVTQEDIIESMLGLEIVDLNDPAIDMQRLARQLWKRRMKDKGIRLSDDQDNEQQ